MHYLTRHLEATRQLEHGGLLIPVGGKIQCTDVDADYYVSKGHAREVDATGPESLPFLEPPPEPATRRRRIAEPAAASTVSNPPPAES